MLLINLSKFLYDVGYTLLESRYPSILHGFLKEQKLKVVWNIKTMYSFLIERNNFLSQI